MPDTISKKQLEHLLAPRCTLHLYDRLVSTNQTAKEKAASGAKEGTLIIAEHQTGGKGRLGRSFFSPDESGAYFSLILRPNLKPEDTLLITTAAAVAVCKAIETVSGKNATIKWVNDIFMDGKKVCGILSEAAFSNTTGLDYVVLGIGINVYPPSEGFPPDIAGIAGAVFDVPVAGLKNRLISAVIKHFWDCYVDLTSPALRHEYQARMLLIGQTVTYIKDGVEQQGKVLGIDSAFRLQVERPNGCIGTLSSGEVTIGSSNICK